MRIMPKIALSMCDNLEKSYSKYESHPWMFVTVKTQYCRGWVAAEEEKLKKKKGKKNQKKKTSAETIRHLVLRTGCLINKIKTWMLTFSSYVCKTMSYHGCQKKRVHRAWTFSPVQYNIIIKDSSGLALNMLATCIFVRLSILSGQLTIQSLERCTLVRGSIKAINSTQCIHSTCCQIILSLLKRYSFGKCPPYCM